jgi:diguanylate cyclase (GGDEF)-like protein
VFVLMMDLDRFKHVNDVMGHNFGDALLRQVAERLQLQLVEAHASAQVARLGGDEFAVLLPGADIDTAQMVAARHPAALEVPLSLEDQTVDIGAGLGIAGYPPRRQCRSAAVDGRSGDVRRQAAQRRRRDVRRRDRQVERDLALAC